MTETTTELITGFFYDEYLGTLLDKFTKKNATFKVEPLKLEEHDDISECIKKQKQLLHNLQTLETDIDTERDRIIKVLLTELLKDQKEQRPEILEEVLKPYIVPPASAAS